MLVGDSLFSFDSSSSPTELNKLSTLYRLNEKFYQLPENIGDRAYGYKIDVNNFIEELMKILKERNVIC